MLSATQRYNYENVHANISTICQMEQQKRQTERVCEREGLREKEREREREGERVRERKRKRQGGREKERCKKE